METDKCKIAEDDGFKIGRLYAIVSFGFLRTDYFQNEPSDCGDTKQRYQNQHPTLGTIKKVRCRVKCYDKDKLDWRNNFNIIFTFYLKFKRFNDRNKFARFSRWRDESCYVVFGKVNSKVYYSSPCKGRCQRKGNKINLLE